MPYCSFTYSHYEEILDLIQGSGYRARFFNEACQEDRELILRHDVDLDLEKACRMAELESLHKIRATYCILVTSPFYNIFDKASSGYVRDILKNGHQIGLHFDETAYSLHSSEDMLKRIHSEVQTVRDLFQTDVFAVSFHRPSAFILQSDIMLGNGLINTYGKSFISGFKYLSDSRRMWKEGCLCGHLKEAFHPRIQALVHPVWWADEDSGAQDTLESFLINIMKHLDGDLEKNIQSYRRIF